VTVIVWDGVRLAADKLSVQSGLKRPVTKIRKLEISDQTYLCGAAGDWDLAQEMFLWFRNGAKPEDEPPFMRNKDDWVAFVVITPEKRVLKYERSPYPIDFTEAVEHDGFYVFGNGRELAIGAMAAGSDVVEAIEITSRFLDSCGMGVDVLTFD
jgi:hypothetical protein